MRKNRKAIIFPLLFLLLFCTSCKRTSDASSLDSMSLDSITKNEEEKDPVQAAETNLESKEDENKETAEAQKETEEKAETDTESSRKLGEYSRNKHPDYDDACDFSLIDKIRNINEKNKTEVGDYERMLLVNQKEKDLVSIAELYSEVESLYENYNLASYVVDDTATGNSVVKITMEQVLDGEILSKKDGYAKLGSGELPLDVEREIIGKKAGSTFVLKKKYSESYQNKELAGKELIIQGTIEEVRTAYIMSDETIEILTSGEFTNLGDFRLYGYQSMTKKLKEDNLNLYKEWIFDVLGRMSNIEDPPKEIVEYIRSMLIYERFDGLDAEKTDANESLEEAQKIAKDLMISIYILDKEGIEVTAEDMEEEFDMLRFFGQVYTPEEWSEFLEENPLFKEETLVGKIEEKAAHVVFDKAIVF